MRRHINNKRYDTDTAEMIASRGAETLYRKRTGEYFLHRSEDGNESIHPILFDDALEWAKASDLDAFGREFGDAELWDHRLHVVVSGDAWFAITRKARSDGSSIREVVESLAMTLD